MTASLIEVSVNLQGARGGRVGRHHGRVGGGNVADGKVGGRAPTGVCQARVSLGVGQGLVDRRDGDGTKNRRVQRKTSPLMLVTTYHTRQSGKSTIHGGSRRAGLGLETKITQEIVMGTTCANSRRAKLARGHVGIGTLGQARHKVGWHRRLHFYLPNRFLQIYIEVFHLFVKKNAGD